MRYGILISGFKGLSRTVFYQNPGMGFGLFHCGAFPEEDQ